MTSRPSEPFADLFVGSGQTAAPATSDLGSGLGSANGKDVMNSTSSLPGGHETNLLGNSGKKQEAATGHTNGSSVPESTTSISSSFVNNSSLAEEITRSVQVAMQVEMAHYFNSLHRVLEQVTHRLQRVELTCERLEKRVNALDESINSHTEVSLTHLVAIENKSDAALKGMQVLKDKAELQDATHELAIMATEAVNFAKERAKLTNDEEIKEKETSVVVEETQNQTETVQEAIPPPAIPAPAVQLQPVQQEPTPQQQPQPPAPQVYQAQPPPQQTDMSLLQSQQQQPYMTQPPVQSQPQMQPQQQVPHMVHPPPPPIHQPLANPLPPPSSGPMFNYMPPPPAQPPRQDFYPPPSSNVPPPGPPPQMPPAPYASPPPPPPPSSSPRQQTSSNNNEHDSSTMSTRGVPINKVVDDVAAMGFEKHVVRDVVNTLTANGQSVDLNIVLDKLMNSGNSDRNVGYGRSLFSRSR